MMTVRKLEGAVAIPHCIKQHGFKADPTIGDCQNSQRAKSMVWLSLDHL
jgi:hypothetical protein